MSMNSRDLELQDGIFKSIQKALLYILKMENKELKARDNFAEQLQPLINLYIPTNDFPFQMSHNLKAFLDKEISIACATPVTKATLEMWVSLLNYVLTLRVKRPSLILKIYSKISEIFQVAYGEHTVDTSILQRRMTEGMANYQTEASSAHFQLMEKDISPFWKKQSKQFRKEQKRMNDSRGNPLEEYL